MSTTHSTQLPEAPEHFGVWPPQLAHEAPQWEGWLRSTQLVPPHSAVPFEQLVAHVGFPSVRQPNMHDIVVEAVHVPLPLHSAAVLAMPPVQLAAAPHEVVLEGNTQAFRLAAVPSHFPPHVPVPVQAVRGVVTGVHVPLAAEVEHDSHCPVHASLQQTPSAQ